MYKNSSIRVCRHNARYTAVAVFHSRKKNIYISNFRTKMTINVKGSKLAISHTTEKDYGRTLYARHGPFWESVRPRVYGLSFDR